MQITRNPFMCRFGLLFLPVRIVPVLPQSPTGLLKRGLHLFQKSLPWLVARTVNYPLDISRSVGLAAGGPAVQSNGNRLIFFSAYWCLLPPICLGSLKNATFMWRNVAHNICATPSTMLLNAFAIGTLLLLILPGRGLRASIIVGAFEKNQLSLRRFAPQEAV